MRRSAAPSQARKSDKTVALGNTHSTTAFPIAPLSALKNHTPGQELVAKDIPPVSNVARSKKRFISPLLPVARSQTSYTQSPTAKDTTPSDTTEPSSKRAKVLPLHPMIGTPLLDRQPPRLTEAAIATSTATPSSGQGNLSQTGEKYFNVLWRKKSGKKHKTWDGDGVLIISGSTGVLKDMDGKDIGRATKVMAVGIKPGDELCFGGKDIEISSLLDSEMYKTGRCFMSSSSSATTKLVQVQATTKFKGHTGLCGSAVTQQQVLPQPRHNPNSPHAILLPRPAKTHPKVVKGFGSKRPAGDAGLVDVVIDPLLGQHLRPHQKEGVRFLYECVMQMKNFSGQGAILADEMGLGKTLQTIALLWTLLKQSPFHGEEPAVVKKALVVCPASLIANWQKEFKKWLGDERLRVFAVDSKSTMTDFTLGRVYPVMIIGYEKLRIVQDELKDANFDIIVCDEGHRLKTANIKTTQAIRSLSTRRRVILSGTPIQNDLGEFFSMIDFVNPGLFESYPSFKKIFEDPIVKSRQPNCSIAEADLGQQRSNELSRLTAQFILRRTAQVNSEFLPPKTETVVFCPLSPLQARIYRHFLDSPFLKSCFSADGSRHLTCITALRKLCNSPRLVLDQAEIKDNPDSEGLYTGVTELVMQDKLSVNALLNGGKLVFVASFLKALKSKTSERVVLVSNFTQTLDVLQEICDQNSYGYFRLDGSTPVSKRQDYVDKFNAPTCQKFLFLLSAKSGGVGLNLIGASRLILFDVDWNPSVDQQAMARIHREGQPRPVHIYRLLSSGTIEEKMYQRQLTKIGLSDALMDSKATERSNKFSAAELRDLFTLHEGIGCLTHELLDCPCLSELAAVNTILPLHKYKHKGGFMDAVSTSLAKKELQGWTHIDVQAQTLATQSAQSDENTSLEGDSHLVDLAARDRVLWDVVTNTGSSDSSPVQESSDVAENQKVDGPVAFIFIK